jgi:hypothetical protein
MECARKWIPSKAFPKILFHLTQGGIGAQMEEIGKRESSKPRGKRAAKGGKQKLQQRAVGIRVATGQRAAERKILSHFQRKRTLGEWRERAWD